MDIEVLEIHFKDKGTKEDVIVWNDSNGFTPEREICYIINKKEDNK